MGNFIDFYANGGIFNHFITIGLGVALASLVFARREGGSERWLAVCERTLVACLGLGLLGSLFGVVEASAALGMVKPEFLMPAASRAAGILVIPLCWALLGVIPLGIASTVVRFRKA
ncbi:MAG: hypothetical protein KC486_13640 [Myxococcales bacterium]|nr:hypothetical protein [Myxococcales bacterium]